MRSKIMPNEHRHLGPGKSDTLKITTSLTAVEKLNPQRWANKEIEHIFDTRPNITMAQLSDLTGKSIEELKQILMPE